MAFSAYIGIFSKKAGVASMSVLFSITSLEQLISNTLKDLNEVIAKAARKSIQSVVLVLIGVLFFPALLFLSELRLMVYR